MALCSLADLCVCVLILCVSTALCKETRRVSVVRDKNGVMRIVESWHEEALVNASFVNRINQTGWSFLEIVGGQGFTDDALAYAAGMAEGYLTGELVLMHWKNTMAGMCDHPSEMCTKLNDFILNNSRYMDEMISDSGGNDSYWYHVDLFRTQVNGLTAGYSELGLDVLTEHDLFMMQINGDLEDLESALSISGQPEPKAIGAGKCSALIKLLPGNAELFASHDTWNNYQSMLRVYKLYDLKFQTSRYSKTTIPGYRVSFSSYPGILLSGDDFYSISSGLVTTETTFGNSNPALWKYVTPQCVFEAIRNVVANRLATSGKEWSTIFSRYNSGTYNNQWMIVDYKLFERGQKELNKGLLWVLEQLPGLIVAADQTFVLGLTSYWPSFNIPYYSDIYQASGFAEMAAKYGSWFTWDMSPRSLIFARNHTLVTDLDSMISLMRYNNFKHDPLSQCNCTPPYSGENGISARSDLNPANGTYPFGALGHRCHGGTDNKVTSSQMMPTLSCMATSGPTHEQEPVFIWSQSGFSPKPLGHPDVWDFSPVFVSWNMTTD